MDCSEAESLYEGNTIFGDVNARVGGASQGQGQQSVQRGGNKNRQKQVKNSSRQTPAPKRQGGSTKKVSQNNASRKQPRPNTGSRKQANRPSNRKQTKQNVNGRKKKPSGRRVPQTKGNAVDKFLRFYVCSPNIYLCVIYTDMQTIILNHFHNQKEPKDDPRLKMKLTIRHSNCQRTRLIRCQIMMETQKDFQNMSQLKELDHLQVLFS